MSQGFHLSRKTKQRVSYQKTCIGLSWTQTKQWKSAATLKIQKEVHIKVYPVASLFQISEVNRLRKSAALSKSLSVISQESAISILKTIKVDKKLWFWFYDTGSCCMVSRYDAVKSIDSRAVHES